MSAPTAPVRRILLCVTDDDPLSFLQTFAAIKIEGRPLPTEIRILTTPEGQQNFLEKVWMREDGSFFKLCEALAVKVPLVPGDVRLFTDTEGRAVKRLTSPQAVTDAGETLLTLVRDITQDGDTALHLSLPETHPLTPTAALAQACFGRPQDELTFLSQPTPSPLKLRRHLTLAFLEDLIASPIGFLTTQLCPSLRSEMDEATLSGKDRPVLARLSAFFTVTLTLDIPRCTVICEGRPLRLEPALFAVYLWLTQLRLEGCSPVVISTDEAVRTFLDTYASVVDQYRLTSNSPSGYVQSLENVYRQGNWNFPAYFRIKKAKLNHQLTALLGMEAAEPFLIQRFGTRSRSSFGISIERRKILIRERVLHSPTDLPNRGSAALCHGRPRLQPNDARP